MATRMATEILRQEHSAILRMMDAAEEVIWQMEHGQSIAPETLEGILEFFQLFADQCHHAKEEEVFFPLLETKGFSRGSGPVAVMLSEHQQGRSIVRDMAEAVLACNAGDAEGPARWIGAARRYIALLSGHILKENNILFPLAESILSNTEQVQLAGDFEKIEDEKMGRGTHERLHAKMEQLLDGIFELQT